MRSGPPESIFSDVQLITGKEKWRDLKHLFTVTRTLQMYEFKNGFLLFLVLSNPFPTINDITIDQF